ncbi:transcriptional regulator, RpiR family [Cohaesibacter marisflavi]|uniref:Transcriptional regulator, RpiR family n=1 Tax=Cohaesibacter marisflavi TaxID=655353 RepID=A0A1I4ZBE9_9HYPH|nr:MurR/RpiR family transcriptional regulator [Cohaesibacter marisflavi]SFN47517.1 transcriptional regulator, RpiR family [Cohaesibacter marisflavi]
MTDSSSPTSVAEFEKKIAAIKGGLPKRLQDCASFVLRKGDAMAFLTVAQASQESGIAPSAFIRFAQALGMQGYSDLQQLFRRQATQQRPPYRYRINTLRQRGETETDLLFVDFCDSSIASIERLMSKMAPQSIEIATEIICSMPEMHVIGQKRAFPVASYLAYVLGQFDHRVILHSDVGGIKIPGRFRPNEVLLLISFEPYTPEVVQVAEKAKGDGAKIVAITDTPLSPLSGLADVSLEVVEEDVGGFRTYSATFCLAAALSVSVGTRLNPASVVKENI